MSAVDTSKDQLIQALLADPDFMDSLRAGVRTRPERPFFNMAGDQINLLAGTPTGRVQVSPGQTISSASWGNPVWDQSVNCFASTTDRDSQWPTPHDGAMCFTADTGAVWLRRAGVWVSAIGVPPPTTSTTTVSFTDATGEVWVAKSTVNGGAWKRARDALHAMYARSVAFNTPTTGAVFGYDLMSFDDYGIYSGASGIYTCPIAGLYRFMVSAGCNSSGSTSWIQPQLQNGSGGLVAMNMGIGAPAGLPIVGERNYLMRVTAGAVFKTALVASSAMTGRPSTDSTTTSIDYLGTG